MSLETLTLEDVHLALSAEKLKLQISSAVDFRSPSGWNSPLGDAGILEALTTANVWVSRGRRCRLDIKVLFDGKPLGKATRLSILESLGYHLCNARLWSQLSLSTSLENSQSDLNSDSSPDISIFINHDSFSAETQPKAWISDNIDMSGPHGVLCTEFERMYVEFNFSQIQKRSRAASKRLKSSSSDPETLDPMLLDYVSGPEGDGSPLSLEKIVAVFSSDLSNSVGKCFDAIDPHSSGRSVNTVGDMPLPSDNRAIKRIGDVITRVANHRDLRNRSSEEKPGGNENTAKRNEGTSHRIQEKSQKEETPWSYFDDEMLFDLNNDDFEDDEMLFSQATSTATSAAPSLASDHSTFSNFSLKVSMKRPPLDESAELSIPSILTTLPLAPANNLTLLGLRTLIAGPSSQKRELQNIRIRKPPLSTPLSLLVPSMFSPGFKELMAQNSRFLPTISNAICSSWVRNVQGAGLRKKLAALSNSRVSEYHDGDGEVGSADRLVAVVQGRLWRMMQRALFDEGAGRRIWKRDGSDEEVGVGNSGVHREGRQGGGDVEEEKQDEDDGDAESKNFTDYIGEEMIEEEDGLLFAEIPANQGDDESDDGLLEYLVEQERMTVEVETDGMLFGTGAWEGGRCEDMKEPKEQLLLGGSSQEEGMLL